MEKTDWEQLKKKAKEAKRRRDITIGNAIAKGMEIGKKMRKQLDTKEIKEYITTFYGNLAHNNLKTVISRITSSLPDYKSPEEAIQDVVKTFNDKEKLRGIALYESQFLPEHFKPEEAVKRYIDDPKSEYILKRWAYTYPRTDRSYVLYRFVSRELDG